MKKLGFILIVLLVVRLLIPPVALSILNGLLDKKMGVYFGHVQDLDLSLYRGAYQLKGLEIKKRDSNNPPLISAQEIDMSIAWRGLLKKNITTDVTITKARIEIADSQDKTKKQTGYEEPKERWSDVFDTLVPISIETLKIHDSALYFTNRDFKTPLAVKVENIELEASNLRSRDKEELSPFFLKAEIQKHAILDLKGEINILSDPPQVDADIKLEKFKLASINKILRMYIPLDITKGELSLFAEAASEGGRAHGYAKIFLTDVDVIAPKQKYIGPKHFFMEMGSAFGNWFLKNNKSKKVAFKVPFSYSNGKLDIGTSEAFWSAVKNMSDALKPGLEKSVSLKRK